MRRTIVAILGLLTWVVRLGFFSSICLASADWAWKVKQPISQQASHRGENVVPRLQNRRPVQRNIRITPPQNPSSFSLSSLTGKGITFHSTIRTKVNRSLVSLLSACLATALCMAGVPTIVGSFRGRS